ncbi:MAG: AhpC/TSA family protein [Bacteroidota bacterium]
MIYIITSILFLFSCSQAVVEDSKFSLTGITHGIEDGTVLIMDFDSGNTILDSAIVKDNRFEFKTVLPKDPIQVVLHTKDFTHFRFLWLENLPMTFDARGSDFRHANVTGSSIEDLSEEYVTGIDSIPRSEKKRRREFEIEFVETHPNSIHSALMLSGYSTTWGRETTQRLYNLFSQEIKETQYGQTVSKYLQLNREPQIGEKYIDFEMETTEGDIAKLSNFDGKIVLLEFWASNCYPCRKENPNLVKTYQKYNPMGFEIFAVSQDTKRKSWLNAIEKDGLPWLQTSDLKGIENTPSMIYGVRGIPDNFLINREGIIIGRNLRGDELNYILEDLLSE